MVRSVSYTISAGIMLALSAWARHSEGGRFFLMAFCAGLAVACALWRWQTGCWPGDEGLTPENPPRSPRPWLREQAGTGVFVPQARRRR